MVFHKSKYNEYSMSFAVGGCLLTYGNCFRRINRRYYTVEVINNFACTDSKLALEFFAGLYLVAGIIKQAEFPLADIQHGYVGNSAYRQVPQFLMLYLF